MLSLSRQRAALVLVIVIACCYAVFMLLTVFFYEKTQLARNARSTISLLNDSLSADLNDGNYRKYLETLSNRETEFGVTKSVVLKNSIDNSFIGSQSNIENFVCDGKEYEFDRENLLICLYPNTSIAVQVTIELQRFILFKNPLFLTLTIANLIFAGVFIFFFISVLKVYLDGLLAYLTSLSFGEEKSNLVVPEDFKLVSRPIHSLLQKVQTLNTQIEDQAKLNTLVDVSRQVAHDIRSPLSALTIAVQNLNEKTNEKELIVNASKRIEQIANDLLVKAKVSPSAANPSIVDRSSAFDLNDVVVKIVQEKRVQFSELTSDLSPNDKGLKICGEMIEVSRVLSNIINNSIEAVRDTSEGQVSIFVRYYKDSAQVIILDNGPGIEPDILAKLGTKGFTVGKDSGSGLGIYHAKTYLQSINGSFSMNSQVGQGTSVTLTFPIIG